MRFRSKVDVWFYLVFVVAGIGLLFGLFAAVVAGPAPLLVTLVVTLVALGLPVWLLVTTAYYVEGERLRVRAGPFTWNIPIAEIESVRPSRALWSSPALSFDRLRIDYGSGRWILVSPEDKQGFLDAIGQSHDTLVT